MMDILVVSLPSDWERKYVYIENYWMIMIAQYLSSYGYKVSVFDVTLEGICLAETEAQILQMRPKILVYLVSHKNWRIVEQVKKHIPIENCILVYDDLFVMKEICAYISEDDSSIRITLGNLFNLICSIIPPKSFYQRYSEDVLLIGREYLKQVLLEGGECEIIMQAPNREFFPSDYFFDIDKHKQFQRSFETLLLEMKTLCEKYKLRKINIIDNGLTMTIEKIDTTIAYLIKKHLDRVKIGIYILAESLTDNYCDYLIGKSDSIYKISLSKKSTFGWTFLHKCGIM